MNFIEAHKIVHRFCSAVGNRNRNSMNFVPYSQVKESEQNIYDAFVIFFGHMVAYNTRTNEQYISYNTLLSCIPFIIEDKLYNKIVHDNELISNKNMVYVFTHKKEIEYAKNNMKMHMDMAARCFDKYVNRVHEFDYGEYVSELINMKSQYTHNEDEMDFNEFISDYIAKVYSSTDNHYYSDEDFFLFSPFDYMRKELSEKTGSNKYQLYLKYANYIYTAY